MRWRMPAMTLRRMDAGLPKRRFDVKTRVQNRQYRPKKKWLPLFIAMLAACTLFAACGRSGSVSSPKHSVTETGSEDAEPYPESGVPDNAGTEKETLADSAEAESVTEVTAVSMRLARMEGAVSLRNKDGQVLSKIANMRLMGGNEIATAVGSRAGVSLDDTKAVTVGEKSHAVVERRKRDLRLNLENGEMYFSVSKPLEEDESFEIRTSTMVMGVRGTSGYVRSGDTYTYTEGGVDVTTRDEAATDTIILTSGHVTLVAESGEEQEVNPGQRVDISTSTDRTEYTVTDVRPSDFPDLLLLELAADEAMLNEADAQNGDGFKEEVLGAAAQIGQMLPTDGGRTVFRGTVRIFTYDELVAYQDVYIPDTPYTDHNEPYTIVLLDEPQNMPCNSIDGLVTGQVSMLLARNAGLEQYDGQHLIFSMNPGSFWWPSDVSLPISQPRGSDIYVLQPASGYADVIAASADASANTAAPISASANAAVPGSASAGASAQEDTSADLQSVPSGSTTDNAGNAAESFEGPAEQMIEAFENSREEVPEADRGWQETPQGWRFYAMDGMLKDEWLEDADGRWYRFDQDGYMLHDVTGEDGFSLGPDGALLYGGKIYTGADAAAAAVAPAGNGSAATTDGFIFPDSSERLLTLNDLRGKNEWECRIARNEIYARHGRLFRSAELQQYFNSCDWYHGSIAANAFNDETMLSKLERDNIKTIEQYEDTL